MIATQTDREQWVRDHLERLAQDLFPEDRHAAWQLLGIEHDRDRAIVEVEPDPEVVGDVSLKLVVRFDGTGDPECVAVYYREEDGDGYELLCHGARWDGRAPARL